MCLIPLNCKILTPIPPPSSFGIPQVIEFQRNLAFTLLHITGWKHGRVDENNKTCKAVNICTLSLNCISRPCKTVSSGLCRPSLGELLPWPTWGSAGVSASLLLVLMAEKDTQVHKHSSIFFPATYCTRQACIFPCGSFSRQMLETVKNNIWQFQQYSAAKKEIQ